MIKEKVWVEIDKTNLFHNLHQIRSLVGDKVKICSVVKSNAYGHGIIEVAKTIEEKVDFFAVDSLSEALMLKNGGVRKNILILGYTLLKNLEQIIENGFHQVISSMESIEELDKISQRLRKKCFIHLKIETGTSRQGIFIKDLNKFIVRLKQNSKLVLAGVSTHYANIEDTTDPTFALKQISLFKQAIAEIENADLTGFLKHTACSAAIILYPQTHLDMVRIGLSQYGLWSSKETLLGAREKQLQVELKPVLSWKTRIAQIKTLPAGSFVSYGCTEKVEEPTLIAILPIGYNDGFDRKLSSVGTVLIHGKRCKILGRVCMNMAIVNINHLSQVRLEDEVVLIGKQGIQEITAEEIALKAGTINYEIVTRINPNIKRILV